jgi:hypothetical protein
MGRGYSSEQWSAWIDEQRESGLSVAAFCDWIGVSQNAFYVRRRKLEAIGSHHSDQAHAARHVGIHVASSDAEARVSAVPSILSSFVPLSVTASQIIEVDLPCGATVRVPNDDASLRRVLSMLLEAGDHGE